MSVRPASAASAAASAPASVGIDIGRSIDVGFGLDQPHRPWHRHQPRPARSCHDLRTNTRQAGSAGLNDGQGALERAITMLADAPSSLHLVIGVSLSRAARRQVPGSDPDKRHSSPSKGETYFLPVRRRNIFQASCTFSQLGGYLNSWPLYIYSFIFSLKLPVKFRAIIHPRRSSPVV